VPDRLGHDRCRSLDWTKIRHELGYRALTAFGPGLAATVAWHRDHLAWWQPQDPQPRREPGFRSSRHT